MSSTHRYILTSWHTRLHTAWHTQAPTHAHTPARGKLNKQKCCFAATAKPSELNTLEGMFARGRSHSLGWMQSGNAALTADNRQSGRYRQNVRNPATTAWHLLDERAPVYAYKIYFATNYSNVCRFLCSELCCNKASWNLRLQFNHLNLSL